MSSFSHQLLANGTCWQSPPETCRNAHHASVFAVTHACSSSALTKQTSNDSEHSRFPYLMSTHTHTRTRTRTRTRTHSYDVGYIFLASPKGHQVYTLTKIQKGTLYTLTKNRNINPASYDTCVLYASLRTCCFKFLKSWRENGSSRRITLARSHFCRQERPVMFCSIQASCRLEGSAQPLASHCHSCSTRLHGRRASFFCPFTDLQSLPRSSSSSSSMHIIPKLSTSESFSVIQRVCRSSLLLL